MTDTERPKPKRKSRPRPRVTHRLSVQMNAKEWRELKQLVKRLQSITPTSAPVTQRALVLAAMEQLKQTLDHMADSQLAAFWQQESERQDADD